MLLSCLIVDENDDNDVDNDNYDCAHDHDVDGEDVNLHEQFSHQAE